MAFTFKFYHDSALTSEVTSGNPMLATHVVGATDSTDDLIYLGSATADKQLQTVTNPGSDPIVVSVEDSNAGTGAPATEVKLALSSGGLATATAGASLSLSATLTSGVGNAVPIYVRRTSTLSAAGNYTDVSLAVADVTESGV